MIIQGMNQSRYVLAVEDLTMCQNEIMRIMRTKRKVTSLELENRLKINRISINRNLNMLVKYGFIKKMNIVNSRECIYHV
jgi:predicted transcriptional regulator